MDAFDPDAWKRDYLKAHPELNLSDAEVLKTVDDLCKKAQNKHEANAKPRKTSKWEYIFYSFVLVIVGVVLYNRLKPDDATAPAASIAKTTPTQPIAAGTAAPAEQLEQDKLPRQLKAIPEGLQLNCSKQMESANPNGQEANVGSETSEDATQFIVAIFGSNVNFVPTNGRNSKRQEEGEPFQYIYYPEQHGTHTTDGGGLAPLAPDPNEMIPGKKEKYLAFYTQLKSSTFILINSEVLDERRLRQTYRFDVIGKIGGQEEKDAFECTSIELNEKAKIAAAAIAKEAERQRLLDPNEQLIDSIQAKGGICIGFANSLRSGLTLAKRFGDWEKFQRTLGEATEYGC